VTTAHEFFHVIQFGYTYNMSLIWWMEQSAVWMEDRIWDDVNDYLAYLKDFFYYSKSYPIDSNDGNYKYGAVLWPMYLTRKFGDGVIRAAWETLASAAHNRITNFDEVIPGGLNAALNEFGVWNYFTRERAPDGQFYPDGRLFQYVMNMDCSAAANPARDSLLTRSFTSNYAELLFLGGWNAKDGLRVQVNPENGRTHENSLIFYNTPSDISIRRLAQPDNLIPLEKSWSRAILVTTCVNAVDPDGQFHFRADWAPLTGVGNSPLSAFSCHGAFPNPFNPATTIRFTLPETGTVRIEAYNIRGQRTADIFHGEMTAGEKTALWKPENLSGGVYFIHITTPFGTRVAKVLFLK